MLKTESIVLLKTKHGEIYIGQYDCQTDANNNPIELLVEAYAIQIMPTGQQSFNIMMMPVFAPISKDCVTLTVTNEVISMIEPTEELKKQYIAARSNIVVSSTMPNSNSKLIGA